MSSREPANRMDSPRKYRERIHKESKAAEHKNLPFQFSKPTKEKPRNVHFVCENCGRDLSVTEDTVAIICVCNHYNKIEKENKDL